MLPGGETIDAAQRREGGIVKPSAHAKTHDRPAANEDRQIWCQRKDREPCGQQQSARNQYGSAAEIVDASADQGRDQPGDQQAERQAAQ